MQFSRMPRYIKLPTSTFRLGAFVAMQFRCIHDRPEEHKLYLARNSELVKTSVSNGTGVIVTSIKRASGLLKHGSLCKGTINMENNDHITIIVHPR